MVRAQHDAPLTAHSNYSRWFVWCQGDSPTREWLMRSAFNDFVKSPGNREKCTARERLLLLSEMLSLQPSLLACT
jgi:hypothetical protein